MIRGLSGSNTQVSAVWPIVASVGLLIRTRCSPFEKTVSPSRSGPIGASEYNTRGAIKIMAAAIPIDHRGGSVWSWSGMEEAS